MRWIRAYWPDEDVTFLFEVLPDGWPARHIELVGPDLRPRAATNSDEWLRQLELGLEDAYARAYGEPPEAPITDWSFDHEEIDQEQFERVWASARRALEGLPS